MKKIQTVMLIDDDEPTNFIHKKIIESSGVVTAIQVAHSGDEALHMLDDDQSPPDLIFLDINMPAMDGWEFMTQYKSLATDKKEKIVVVMLTTSLNPDDEARAKDVSGVHAYRSKPLTIQMIKEIAETYFS